MKDKLPREEIEADFVATIKDAIRLTAIVQNLTEFINDSGGENRAHLRTDLLRYKDLLATASKLEAAIREALDSHPDNV